MVHADTVEVRFPAVVPATSDVTAAPAVTAVGVLAAANVVSNRVLPRSWYVPWNMAVALGLTVIALGWDRRSPHEVGFVEWRQGLRWGAGTAGGVTALYLCGLALPATRELFDDDRASEELSRLLFDAFVAVPLGTVVLEEVAFRGVVPALFESRWGPRAGVGGAAALFGLWHVLPSWTLGSANAGVRTAVEGPSGRLLTVAGSVLGTAAAGVAFSWLRRRSGSLLAPVILHTSTNSLGYLLAGALRHWRAS